MLKEKKYLKLTVTQKEGEFLPIMETNMDKSTIAMILKKVLQDIETNDNE